MKSFWRLALFVGLALGALWAGPGPAAAQWPERGLTLIAPMPEKLPWGQEANPEAAALAELAPRLSRELGVPITVVRELAGGGVMAANNLASARPDGYTIGLLPSEATMTRVIQGRTPYTWSEFLPVAAAWTEIYALIALDKLPYDGVADLAGAKGRLKVGHTGLDPASPETVMAVRTIRDAGLTADLVFFKSLDPDVLMRGEADLMVWPLSTFNLHPEKEHLKILAVLTPEYKPENYAVKAPLYHDSGRLSPFTPSWSFYLPSKTGQAAAARLAGAIGAALDEPNLEKFLKDSCMAPLRAAPGDSAAFLNQEYQGHEILLKQLGLI